MMSEGDRICWVVKIGSSLLADRGAGLNEGAISDLVAQVAALRDQGIDIVLVIRCNSRRYVPGGLDQSTARIASPAGRRCCWPI